MAEAINIARELVPEHRFIYRLKTMAIRMYSKSFAITAIYQKDSAASARTCEPEATRERANH